jgi:O-antigen/teichoic acid export membrane protein
MNIRNKVLIALRWSAGLRLFSQLATWVMTLLVIRLLSPEDYGLMAIASGLIAFFSLFNELGIGAALIQREEISETEQRQTFGIVLVINFSLFGAIYFASPFVADFFDTPRLTDLIRVVAVQLPIIAFLVVPESLLIRAMDFKRKSIIELIANISAGAITLSMAYSGLGVWSLVTGSVSLALIKVIGINIIAPFAKLPMLNFRGTRHIVAFGGLITIDRVLWFFYSKADVFIIGKILGTEILGFYSVAMNIAALPMQKINGILNSIAFPAFARIQSDKEKVAEYLKKALQVVGFFAFPIFFGISSVAADFVPLILGEKWIETVTIIALLSLIMPLRMASNLVTATLQGVGRADISAVNLLIASMIMPTAFFAGAKVSLIGVCMAWLSAFPVVLLIEILRSSKHVNLSAAGIARTMAKPAIIAAAMYLVVWSCGQLIAGHLPEVTQLSMLILAGALSYWALTIAINKMGYKEVIGLLKG